MKQKKQVRNWIKRNHRIINILITIIGFIAYYIGAVVIDKTTIWAEFYSQIGLALMANSVLLMFSLLYFKQDDDYEDAKDIYEEKGLVAIYDTKQGINEKINGNLLPNHRIKDYDIICCGGLTTLRKQQGNRLIEYVKQYKMQIRILTANPNLEYLLQQKIDEESELTNVLTYKTSPIDNTIRQSIFELYEWVDEKKKSLPDELRENIQIRFYNSLPPLQYHRVGSNVFVGQSVIGSNSQSTPTFEYFDNGSSASYFNRYTKYFESLWNDPNYAQREPNSKLNAQLIINDSLINNILKLSCGDLSASLNEANHNKIRAVLSICGYPKPQKDGLERRYNTNIARGNEVCNILESNGETINGNKQGYLATDSNQVVGRAIASGKIHFETTKIPNRYSILVIPLKNNYDKVVAAVSFEFDDDFNDRLHITEDSDCIIDQNTVIIDKAKTWAKLLAIYLGIEDKF